MKAEKSIKTYKTRLVSFVLVSVMCLSLAMLGACGEEAEQPSKPAESQGNIDLKGIDFNTEGNVTELNYETENPVVAIYVKDYGVIVAELYPDVAPNTVNSFLSLVRKGFYDNNSIHRMIPGFVIQGGDPLGTGTGGPGYSIKGEFTKNNFTNNLKHTEGVLSMARQGASNDADDANYYNTAGSQFFIMLGTAEHLDGKYASFGKVIDGMDVCREIEKIAYRSLSSGKLGQNLTIVKMVADLNGKTYPEPEVIPD